MYIKGGYLYFDDEQIKKPKKITGHSFVQLIDKDIFNPKGDAMINILKFLKNEPIDEFYTNRGEIAEQLVKRSYEKKGHKYQVWDKKEIGFDNFKNISQIFGGLLDGLLDDNIVVEVKSKSINKYDEITKNGVEQEELQALFYATLLNLNVSFMEWVFFTPEQEELIKLNKPITDFKGCIKYSKQLEVNHNKIIEYMNIAYIYYSECINNKRIPCCDISDNVMNKLLKEKGLIFCD